MPRENPKGLTFDDGCCRSATCACCGRDANQIRRETACRFFREDDPDLEGTRFYETRPLPKGLNRNDTWAT